MIAIQARGYIVQEIQTQPSELRLCDFVHV